MQEIYSLDFSRDGRFLVSGSGDKSARVWDIEKGTCVFDLRIEDFLHNEHGPIDAGITSVARKSLSTTRMSWSGRRYEGRQVKGEGRREEGRS
jgi:WD40 repeat protein